MKYYFLLVINTVWCTVITNVVKLPFELTRAQRENVIKSPGEYFETGKRLYNEHDYKGARNKFGLALQLAKNKNENMNFIVVLTYNLAKCHWMLSQYDLAVKEFTYVIDNREHAEAWLIPSLYHRGHIHFSRDNLVKAHQDLAYAVRRIVDGKASTDVDGAAVKLLFERCKEEIILQYLDSKK